MRPFGSTLLLNSLHGLPLVLATILATSVLLSTGCGEDWLPMTSGVPTSSDPQTSTGTTGLDPTTGGPSTTSGTTAASTDAPTTDASSGTTEDTGAVGGMCDVYKQDCPKGQKCTGYGPPNTFVPIGVKCVPEAENPVPLDEPCVVGGNGLGDDNCIEGSVCLDLDYDGNGFCLQYCGGSKDMPDCGSDTKTCVQLFFGFDLGNCFNKCDPLIQNCKDGEGCYMDSTTIGNSGFVCMPVSVEGLGLGFGDACIGWSSCVPGYACVFEQFVAGCDKGLCCTPWCDITDMNPCAQFDPSMECIAWFNGVTPPPGLENVGICGVPQ